MLKKDVYVLKWPKYGGVGLPCKYVIPKRTLTRYAA
jgi:hypothetical protein